jgi:hypothetical protein
MIGMPLGIINYGQSIPDAVIPDFVNMTVHQSIFVAEVYSPHRFWFHWAKASDALDTMMNDLDMCYNQMKDYLKISECNLVKGQVCVAKYEGFWHRAEILDGLCKGNMVKVLYVDYGTVGKVPLIDIKFLLEQFADLPKQAFRGTLDLILPVFLTKKEYTRGSWQREATRFFLRHAEKMVFSKIVYIDNDQKIFYMEVTETNTCVNVDTNINEALICKNLAYLDNELYTSKAQAPYEHYKKRYQNVEPTFEKLEKGNRPSFTEIGVYAAKG